MNMLMKDPKELILEEKSKSYNNEALEKAKELYSDAALSQPVRNAIEYIFPELKKMEEEEIRLDIVDIIKSQKNIDGSKLDKMIDWLEKQGEKLQESIKEESNKESNRATIPEFKIGDWVVVDKSPLQIRDICDIHNYTYKVKFEDGAFRNYDVNVLEKSAHLWTIEDAKVGDVLCSGRDSIILFAGVYGGGPYCKYHVALTIDGKFLVNENGGDHLWGTTSMTYPATKEQQDLLFQKMVEKGYRWNSENKKIELLPQEKPQKKQKKQSSPSPKKKERNHM